MTQLTYKDSGVDIDSADQLIDDISPFVKKTMRPEVMSHLGGYAGLFALDVKKYPQPLLVSTTDGVGTKLKLAFDLKKYDTVGQDLVAMCVNDLICCGAEPLFFLDYFATGQLEVGAAQTVIRGIAQCLADINCTLIGGETAEMPGFYAKGEFDLAGFTVGVVNRDRIINGNNIQPGHKIIGLHSSGVHSNGFSLVRKILESKNLNLNQKLPGLNQSIGETLLKPTLIYVNPILKLLQEHTLLGIAHITGGGLVENVPRILPENTVARFEKSTIPTPAIFKFLQQEGQVPEPEMWRVFNMGVGLVVVVDAKDEKAIVEKIQKNGFNATTIGEIVARKNQEAQVQLI